MGWQLVIRSFAAAAIGCALGGAARADGAGDAEGAAAPAADPAAAPSVASPAAPSVAASPVTTADELSPAAPPPQPVARVESPPVRAASGAEPRKGLTMEISLGAGWFSADGYSGTGEGTSLMLSGSAAIGGWLTKRVALTGRVVGLTGEDDEIDAFTLFAGPSAQVWFGERFWVSGGLGLAIAAVEDKTDEFGVGTARPGAGMDLRVGYTHVFDPFAALHFSAEATPWLIDGKSTLTLTLMAGLQML